MTTITRKKGNRANGVSRQAHEREVCGCGRFANENRVANDVPKVGARQTETSTNARHEALEGSRPPLSHRYHSLTHSGPSSAGRADEYCRSLAPTQSSLVLSTHDPPQQEHFPFPYPDIHNTVLPSTPLSGNCQLSSRPAAFFASRQTLQNIPQTPRDQPSPW